MDQKTRPHQTDVSGSNVPGDSQTKMTDDSAPGNSSSTSTQACDKSDSKNIPSYETKSKEVPTNGKDTPKTKKPTTLESTDKHKHEPELDDVLNEAENTSQDDPLDNKKPSTSTESANKTDGEILHEESNSKQSLSRDTETKSQPTSHNEVIKEGTSTLGNGEDEEVTRTTRRSMQILSRKLADARRVIPIENVDWYYEKEDYYKKKYEIVWVSFATDEEPHLESNSKFYTYLLIDPRRYKEKLNIIWSEFIEAIFYIGKGTGNRAFIHTCEAKKFYCQFMDLRKVTDKHRKIIEIWSSRNPVKLFLVTKNITTEEAHTREAAMIDALGTEKLCNMCRGTYYIDINQLKARELVELGATLLLEAFEIFKREDANVRDVHYYTRSTGRFS